MRRCRTLLLLIMMVINLLSAGCSRPDAEDVIRSATLLDIRWEPYMDGAGNRSSDTSLGFDRAQLFVPAKIESVDTFLQLDTGAGPTILWRSTLDRLGIRYTLEDKSASAFGISGQYGTIPNLVIGDFVRTDVRVLILNDEAIDDERPTSIGLLGCDLLRGSSLYLDFVESKFAILSSRARARGVYIPCTLDGRSRPRLKFSTETESIVALYDTGASLFTLMVSPGRFTRLTGLTWSDPSLYAIEAARPDAPLNVKASINPIALSVEGGSLICPVIWTSPMRDIAVPQDESSLIGNQLFRDRRILLDFRTPSLVILDARR